MVPKVVISKSLHSELAFRWFHGLISRDEKGGNEFWLELRVPLIVSCLHRVTLLFFYSFPFYHKLNVGLFSHKQFKSEFRAKKKRKILPILKKIRLEKNYLFYKTLEYGNKTIPIFFN